MEWYFRRYDCPGHGKIRLESVQLYPDVKNKQVKAVISFSNNTPAAEHALLSMKVSARNGSQQLEEQVKRWM